ncbi:GntR family transcriptional regulator [Streptomyces sp. CB00316]|uniref:GntR family transcriptional regulator n=1 Tax=unclassified Streptomyces TaxID=2593676 RepID=UPI00093D46D3|nr:MULTISPECIES: GntR family transcriptional regulator [unclassified Streptomyces]MBT2381684.1 GntR family transcriptional regulator [Streptomyces sp. ISL-111]MBT2428905.1 GntR family transcriptional regulator [Streptomyces sp. ISL-112]MBT2464197.1 GntR family transcriptional regulator [Streptomyces sp. ISL-63]OKJ20134.1 GntR family transcriptional regulator [Streptomyces sp. CB00316]
MFDERSPIYLQVADRVRADIVSGALNGDQPVTSTTQYATFHRINPATVAKAYQQLVDEGLLYKKRGIGMFVAPAARSVLLGQRRERFFTEVVDAMVDEARTIGVPLTEVIDRLRQAAVADEVYGTAGRAER